MWFTMITMLKLLTSLKNRLIDAVLDWVSRMFFSDSESLQKAHQNTATFLRCHPIILKDGKGSISLWDLAKRFCRETTDKTLPKCLKRLQRDVSLYRRRCASYPLWWYLLFMFLVIDDFCRGKYRFALALRSGTIRLNATNGHQDHLEPFCTPVTAEFFDRHDVVHGGYAVNKSSIDAKGLLAGRNHYHVHAVLIGKREYTRCDWLRYNILNGQQSGYRPDCDMLWHIDASRMIRDGGNVYLTRNGVIVIPVEVPKEYLTKKVILLPI